MSWWGSNPFDEVVEEATSELLPGGQENLALNLDISDRIRSKKVNAKDAMQSLKKRLAHKNPNVQLATLSLLDTCVKNSGDIFISQVAKREFMDALVDIVKSPTCNLDVKTKLLGIIKTWGMASRNRPNICYIYDTYVLLRAEGMLFPASTENLDGIFFETAAAPEWSDSDVCERCRTAFTLTNRKHHCRRCGGTFCQQCSEKSLSLPQLGINEAVRVCDGCYIKVKLENAGNRTTQPVAVEAPKPTTNNSEFDNDIEKAIALSLKEAEQQKNNSGFVQSMPKEETPVMEEDPDLAAAIAASLNDLNISKEEPKSDEITSSEIENILLFHTLMDRIAMAGGNASNDPQVNELYNQIGALHPKLIKNVDETIRKRNMFIELHQKLNTVVKTYDRVLEERISQHQPTYHPPPSYNPQDQYYHGYHQPPDQRYSPIPAQPVEKVDDAPLIEFCIMAAILEKIAKLAIPAGLIIGGAQSAMYDVQGGYRAVIFDRIQGVKQVSVGEGTHFLVPWLQRAVLFDVRTKPRNISTTTGSKDMQMVSLTLRVLHRPELKNLSSIYQNLGEDYDERVLPSIGNEVLKAIVAQFDASELITQREVVSAKIREELYKRARDFNLELEDVSITHMTFGKEFTNAVEQKQIAQQEAERARFIVDRAEQEKQASIIRAEGDSQAAEMISSALSKAGEGFIAFRKIEASKEIAQTLSQARNVTYLPNNKQGSNLLLNVGTA